MATEQATLEIDTNNENPETYSEVVDNVSVFSESEEPDNEDSDNEDNEESDYEEDELCANLISNQDGVNWLLNLDSNREPPPLPF
jgi:hypothetical protein